VKRTTIFNVFFDKLTSTYDDLVVILPNILGNNLPNFFTKKLDVLLLKVQHLLQLQPLKLIFSMITALGKVTSNLYINNINEIDKASYIGTVILDNFDLGTMIDQKDLEKFLLILMWMVKGLIKSMNTAVNGQVSQIEFKGYNYTNIT
jgi:hypothetical protein